MSELPYLSLKLRLDTSAVEYLKRFQEYFEKSTELNAADLARYVCHRKAILDFLQNQLSMKDDGRYRREEQIHRIIFPMGKTSNDVPLEGHNLWLVDEKLVYHAFLSSDKQLRQTQPLQCDSEKEPDVIVFDKACAFVPDVEAPFTSVTIIELKRPMRGDYSEDENPFVQVATYIDDIRAGKAITPGGRPVPVRSGTPFYCYIICDITATLERWARLFELEKTPDQQGFFGYKRNYGAYVEVISYDKMLADAKKRNAVFFDKLGLSARIS